MKTALTAFVLLALVLVASGCDGACEYAGNPQRGEPPFCAELKKDICERDAQGKKKWLGGSCQSHGFTKPCPTDANFLCR